MNTFEILPKDDGFQDYGTVCAANESRFTASHYSEPLTAFTVGWKDRENIESLLNFLAPMIPVSRRFEFKVANNNEAFLSETDDIRSIGSAFKRIEFIGTSVISKTFNKGLTIRVDHDDVAGDDWRERYVQLLLQRLYRNELRRAISALEANAQTSAPGDQYIWSDESNPDADIRSELEAATDITGVRPNRIIIGEAAWDIRANSYDAQNNAGANRAAGLTLEELACKLFVDEIRVINARYQNTATSKSAVLGNSIYAFFANNETMKDEPANIKRFVTPADGSSFRVYIEEHSKFSDITVEHYSNIVITSTTGIRKLTVSATEPVTK
ncbi:MAG: hypothetical protein LBI37_03615 [Puniceicoccales bacterium]|jgi:hypothetical protein|nr:hypothetical protein [Puniceicoccales bacterium]